jgi:hypothetical protein
MASTPFPVSRAGPGALLIADPFLKPPDFGLHRPSLAPMPHGPVDGKHHQVAVEAFDDEVEGA